MNKAELVEKVREMLGAQCSKAHAERSVNSVLQSIETGLKEDQLVQLVGFGTFEVKQRPARSYRNPRTGEMMEAGPSTTVGFRPGSMLKDGIAPSVGADC